MQITQLKVGDLIETAPLMSKMDPEKVVLMVVGKEAQDTVEVEATYFGVKIGTATVTLADEKETWEWAYGN